LRTAAAMLKARDLLHASDRIQIRSESHGNFHAARRGVRKAHGVARNFAHVMIAGTARPGLPAAYVFGISAHLSPPGNRPEGADATHAWVTVWCGAEIGGSGSIPPNDLLIGNDNIVLAVGRDFYDVSPVDGVNRRLPTSKLGPSLGWSFGRIIPFPRQANLAMMRENRSRNKEIRKASDQSWTSHPRSAPPPDVRRRRRGARRSVLMLKQARIQGEKIPHLRRRRCNFTNFLNRAGEYFPGRQSALRHLPQNGLTTHTISRPGGETSHCLDREIARPIVFATAPRGRFIDMLLAECRTAGAQLRLGGASEIQKRENGCVIATGSRRVRGTSDWWWRRRHVDPETWAQRIRTTRPPRQFASR